MTNLFLDTEWAKNETFELVSVGLVSEDGRHRFYAERKHLPNEASVFVRGVVYPLLERGKRPFQMSNSRARFGASWMASTIPSHPAP